jgi:hypothetical protein
MCIDPIILEEMNGIPKTFKNRKAPDSGELGTESFKYASTAAKL